MGMGMIADRTRKRPGSAGRIGPVACVICDYPVESIQTCAPNVSILH